MSVSPIILEPIPGDSTEVAEWLVVQVIQKRVTKTPLTFEQAQMARDLHKFVEPGADFTLVHKSAFPS